MLLQNGPDGIALTFALQHSFYDFCCSAMTPGHSALRSRKKLDIRSIEPKLACPTRNPMRKIILITAAAALLVSACNTVAGVGRDAQSAGKAVTKAAKK